jgi:hypothetical protein
MKSQLSARFATLLCGVVVSAFVFGAVGLYAQVTGPNSDVSTKCGVSGVDVNGNCLTSDGGRGVSTTGGSGGGCVSTLLANGGKILVNGGALCISDNTNYLLDAGGGFMLDDGTLALIGG